MTFDRARAVADAVLFEGYALYPYRASSLKNQFRWAFGILAPRTWSEAGGCEPWWMEAQCLVEPVDGARLEGRLRFLHVRRRAVEVATDGGFVPVAQAEVDGSLLVSWDEGEVVEVPLACGLDEACAGEVVVPFALDGGTEVEEVRDRADVVAARVVRAREPLRGVARIRAERIDAAHPLLRLGVRVENHTPGARAGADREAVLRASCVGAHLLLAVDEPAAFVSLLDPPVWAEAAAERCRCERAFPVLAGRRGQRDLVLASPIILYDHPEVAPESPGDFFDACEIDELLALRTATLTPEEKRQARATDPRAAAVVDRTDALPTQVVERLHGAIRALEAAEMVPRDRPVTDPTAEARVGLRPGMRVRLRPGARRTDAQDVLYAGQLATVQAVRLDVDGEPHVAVTIDADPGADLHRWYGRFQYWRVDELERLPAGASA